MNTPTTEPSAYIKRFFAGFGIFFVGLLLTLFDSSEQQMIGYAGVAVMFTGFMLAMTGYIPMIWHRLTAHKKRRLQNPKARP